MQVVLVHVNQFRTSPSSPYWLPEKPLGRITKASSGICRFASAGAGWSETELCRTDNICWPFFLVFPFKYTSSRFERVLARPHWLPKDAVPTNHKSVQRNLQICIRWSWVVGNGTLQNGQHLLTVFPCVSLQLHVKSIRTSPSSPSLAS
jgi:hypothetical protein